MVSDDFGKAEWIEERAAIIEHEAKWRQAQAEWKARECWKDFLKQKAENEKSTRNF